MIADQSQGIISPAARLAAGAVAVTAWTGMAVQFSASLDLAGSPGAALWVMLRYFTIIANLLAAFLFTGIMLRNRYASPRLLGGVVLAMLLVGVVYGLLLRGLLELSGGARLADLLLHSVTPVLVPLYWLVFARTGELSRSDPWLWCLLPLLYFGYALARGVAEGIYAYPFMNVARLGWPQTVANAVLMALGFLTAGYVLVGLDRLPRRSKAK